MLIYGVFLVIGAVGKTGEYITVFYKCVLGVLCVLTCRWFLQCLMTHPSLAI